jgi:hypothetical protein
VTTLTALLRRDLSQCPTLMPLCALSRLVCLGAAGGVPAAVGMPCGALGVVQPLGVDVPLPALPARDSRALGLPTWLNPAEEEVGVEAPECWLVLQLVVAPEVECNGEGGSAIERAHFQGEMLTVALSTPTDQPRMACTPSLM